MAPLGTLIGSIFVGTLSLSSSVQQAGLAPGKPFDELQEAKDGLREIAGVREYSGYMIVRPLDLAKAHARGMDMREQRARSDAAIDALERLAIYEYIPETDEYIVALPAGEDERGFHKRLMDSGNFEYAQPDWVVFPIGCPNDANFASQWHHQKLGSCTAWNYSTGSTAITVAVLDTGVRTSHADLSGLNREGFNAVTRSWESAGGQIADINGHGTMTTGLVSARGNNTTGVSGMGWTISYRPVRVSDDSGGGSNISTLTAAARTACDAGDRVVSVSYSGVSDPAVESTGAYLRSKGSLLVWAAGNYAEVHSGTRADNVIIVGASDGADNLTSWSGRGQRLDFVAPGVGIYSTMAGSNSSYGAADGTSFSTPIVAGLCGLILSRNPALSPAQVESILRASAVDLGAAGPDDLFGYGRINAAAALAMAGTATRHTLWATSVPETSSPSNTVPWTNESYAAGAETCDDCNSSTCQYATNSTSGNTTALTANDLASFTLPSGHKIVKVEVEVSGRYNAGTSASIGIRAFAPSYAIDSGWRNTPVFISGNRCGPRAGSVGDITALDPSWTAAKINNLQFQVRRQANLSGNTLRIVSMKIVVTTQPV
ncbi:MAG: S8 family peptidase [Planctomycetota bacterium]